MQSRFAGLVPAMMVVMIGQISGLSLTVKDLECIHEYAQTNDSPISGYFIVGGRYWMGDHLGINFTVTSPSGAVIHSDHNSFGSKFDLVAPVAGMYKFCFKNTYYKIGMVTFFINIGHTFVTDEHNMTKNEHFRNIFYKMYDLKKSLDSVKEEHKYLIDRNTVHLWINESVRNRIVTYKVAEYLLLVVLSTIQIIYVRSLFKNK